MKPVIEPLSRVIRGDREPMDRIFWRSQTQSPPLLRASTLVALTLVTATLKLGRRFFHGACDTWALVAFVVPTCSRVRRRGVVLSCCF